MIGLDTNVIVRYIMQDDPKQSKQATAVMEGLIVDLIERLSANAGCQKTMTFDRNTARSAKMTLIH
jgi:predicted nucleic-acid-binding protein